MKAYSRQGVEMDVVEVYKGFPISIRPEFFSSVCQCTIPESFYADFNGWNVLGDTVQEVKDEIDERLAVRS